MQKWHVSESLVALRLVESHSAAVGSKLELEKKIDEFRRTPQYWTSYELYDLDGQGERLCYKLKADIGAVDKHKYICKQCADKGVTSGLEMKVLPYQGVLVLEECSVCNPKL